MTGAASRGRHRDVGRDRLPNYRHESCYPTVRVDSTNFETWMGSVGVAWRVFVGNRQQGKAIKARQFSTVQPRSFRQERIDIGVDTSQLYVTTRYPDVKITDSSNATNLQSSPVFASTYSTNRFSSPIGEYPEAIHARSHPVSFIVSTLPAGRLPILFISRSTRRRNFSREYTS